MGSGSSISRLPDKAAEVTQPGVDLGVSETSCSKPSSKKSRSSSASKVRPAVTNGAAKDHESTNGYVRLKEIAQVAEAKAEKSEASLMEMEKQMALLESENFDLQDQISNLENELEYYKNTNAINEQKDCDETLKAKDQYIEKLEKETKTVQEEINKLRIKFKKRLRAANAQIAETKQGNSLKIFELKNEMTRLQEENDLLQEKTKHPVGRHDDAVAAVVDIPEDSRTRIILDLSSKVSEQDSKNHQLQCEISQKDKQIELLNKLLSQNGITSKVTQLSHKSKESYISDSADVTEKTELSEMKQIAVEMKKLKKRQKIKQRKTNHDSGNQREFSSTSRDSGVDEYPPEELGSPCTESHLTRGKVNDGWDSDSDSPLSKDLEGNRQVFAQSSGPDGTDEHANSSSGLDPSSIRRISAPRRRGKTPVDEDTEECQKGISGKPPVSIKKSKCLADDVDALIQSIDEDVRCVNAVTFANNRQTVISH